MSNNPLPIDPHDIFTTLPSKDKRYHYPYDVQTTVWDKWFAKRDRKNSIIKMNTGSGKTVVGLIILQSCLNEGKGPAVYVTPDNYLVQQVCKEAQSLGIKTVTDANDFDYTEKRAILVIPIQKLVNGKSIFRSNPGYGNRQIGSIVIDDVHACLDKILEQFSLRISGGSNLYQELITLFAATWKEYDSSAYTDVVESQDPRKTELLPFWIWQQNQKQVRQLLKESNNDENNDLSFNLPLIEDCLSSCNCVISARCIEITPKGIDIAKIENFENATRRIFMSATLADDGVFVSTLGLSKDEITETTITPTKANDIGTRLILFPSHQNSTIDEGDIRSKLKELSQKFNVVIIVPSRKRAEFWDNSGEQTMTKENIEKGIEALKNRSAGLTVLVNRYDGIDLPDDACRILVIDNLPPLRSEYDKYVQSVSPTNNILVKEQIQRIEQGMGRGTRSVNDYCCIVLMGKQLDNVLINCDGTRYFSNATSKQYRLSNELWQALAEQQQETSIDDIFALAEEYSLNNNPEWITKNKEQLLNATYGTPVNVDLTTVALKSAFDKVLKNQFLEAANSLDATINEERNNRAKGLLLQTKAEYMNFIDQSRAQQILKSAHSLNSAVLTPIEGIQYDKLINRSEQPKVFLENIKKNSLTEPNHFSLSVQAVLSCLNFSPEAHEFEENLRILGELLGFKSSRPEQEIKRGPDNLWALGEGRYLVIECKTGTTTDSICKQDCNQLNGSENWFKNQYDEAEYSCAPIMIHNSDEYNFDCSPSRNTRIMTPQLLEKMKKNVHNFSTACVQNDNWQSSEKIAHLFQQYKLRGGDIVNEYTSIFSQREKL